MVRKSSKQAKDAAANCEKKLRSVDATITAPIFIATHLEAACNDTFMICALDKPMIFYFQTHQFQFQFVKIW
jgi:hypothetical protein